jgi:MFS family permease
MPETRSAGIDSPRAWLIVVAAFFASFVAFGVSYSFGIFLKPMATEFGVSHAVMSTLFSVLTVLSLFLSPLTGDIADHVGPRPVMIAGALLMGAGLILTARVHYFPLVFLTYGLGAGAAVACVYVPSIAAVGEWFKLHRDIALGIAISGIGCGTLVAAPVAAMLISRYGWRTTFEIFGAVSAVLLLVCAALIAAPSVVTSKTRNGVMAKIRNPVFALLYAGFFFAGVAIFISFVYLPEFAINDGATQVAAAGLVGYIGASSVVGRLGLNALAPRFGLVSVFQVSYAALLVSFVFWLGGHSYTSLVWYCLVLGIAYGGIVAMSPAMLAQFFGVEGLGELFGFLLTGFGLASVAGPPLAGLLIDRSGDLKWPPLLAAASAAVALVAVIPLRVYGSRRIASAAESAAAAAE